MSATRLFVSFDFDNDQDLRDLLIGQAKNPDSPFEVTDYSVREPESGDWEKKIRARIRLVSQVAVICGNHTDTATGVAAEVKIAREEERPYFLLAGRADGNNKKPTTALSTDSLYKWTWENLKNLIAGQR
jgi:hypothetical protein